MEQIKFSDLFDEGGISGGLKNMVTQIESVKAELLNMLKEVKDASAGISSSLSSTSSVSKGAGMTRGCRLGMWSSYTLHIKN